MQHSSYSYPASASVASKTACSHNNNMLPSTLSSDSSAIRCAADEDCVYVLTPLPANHRQPLQLI
eukprot:scaffold1847_cov18-Tisochrysis_lutea.AAC.1